MKTKNNTMSGNIRLRLIVEGDIQGVGYRVLVKYIARNLKIRGFARNLPDGTVEIFCEGDKKSIDIFKKKINIKVKNGGFFSVNVKNIKESAIKKLPEKPQIFDVKYEEGEARSPFEKTNLERLEIGSLILSDFRNDTNQNFKGLNSKTDKLNSTMNTFRKEAGQNLKELVSETDKFREETNQNFITMENRYGDIYEQTVKMESTISKLTEEFVKSNQNNAKLIETLITKLDKVIK